MLIIQNLKAGNIVKGKIKGWLHPIFFLIINPATGWLVICDENGKLDIHWETTDISQLDYILEEVTKELK